MQYLLSETARWEWLPAEQRTSLRQEYAERVDRLEPAASQASARWGGGTWTETPPEEAAPAVPPPFEPEAPRSDVLAGVSAFLEERNIRWFHGLGALLLLSAGVSVLTTQWEGIGHWIVLGLLLVSPGLCYFISARLRTRLPMSAQVLSLLGGLLLPACLGAVHHFDVLGLGGVSLASWYAGTFAVTAGVVLSQAFRYVETPSLYVGTLAAGLSVWFLGGLLPAGIPASGVGMVALGFLWLTLSRGTAEGPFQAHLRVLSQTLVSAGLLVALGQAPDRSVAPVPVFVLGTVFFLTAGIWADSAASVPISAAVAVLGLLYYAWAARLGVFQFCAGLTLLAAGYPSLGLRSPHRAFFNWLGLGLVAVAVVVMSAAVLAAAPDGFAAVGTGDRVAGLLAGTLAGVFYLIMARQSGKEALYLAGVSFWYAWGMGVLLWFSEGTRPAALALFPMLLAAAGRKSAPLVEVAGVAATVQIAALALWPGARFTDGAVFLSYALVAAGLSAVLEQPGVVWLSALTAPLALAKLLPDHQAAQLLLAVLVMASVSARWLGRWAAPVRTSSMVYATLCWVALAVDLSEGHAAWAFLAPVVWMAGDWPLVAQALVLATLGSSLDPPREWTVVFLAGFVVAYARLAWGAQSRRAEWLPVCVWLTSATTAWYIHEAWHLPVHPVSTWFAFSLLWIGLAFLVEVKRPAIYRATLALALVSGLAVLVRAVPAGIGYLALISAAYALLATGVGYRRQHVEVFAGGTLLAALAWFSLCFYMALEIHMIAALTAVLLLLLAAVPGGIFKAWLEAFEQVLSVLVIGFSCVPTDAFGAQQAGLWLSMAFWLWKGWEPVAFTCGYMAWGFLLHGHGLGIVEAWTLPAALWLGSWGARRGQPTATSAGLAVFFLPSLLASLAPEGGMHALAVGLGGLLVVARGVAARNVAWLTAGSLALLAEIVIQAVAVAAAMPWQLVAALGGGTLVVLGVLFERQRLQILSAGRRMWGELATWQRH
ncbi:MAG TPA: hypothetical protein VGO93_21550 [Candidatus Xenobia bacterium]